MSDDDLVYIVNLGRKFGEGDIPKDAMDAVIAADPELEWTTPADAAPMGENRAEMRSISWRGTPTLSYSMMWIEWQNPSPDGVVKLIQIARALGGSAFDSGGDRLVLKKKLFGGEKVVVENDEG